MSACDDINLITPDSSLCLSDSDESVSDLIQLEAQVTAEHIAAQKAVTDPVPRGSSEDGYCIPACKHMRKQGSASMSKCCICMTWFHLTCLGEDDEEGDTFWSCFRCRNLTERVNELSISMNNKLDKLYMKLDAMYHLNTKLLGVIQKSNLENKQLRQQVNNLIKSCTSKHIDKSDSVEKAAVPVVPTVNNSFQSVCVNQSHVSSQKRDDVLTVCGNDEQCQGTDLNIVCDSIPTYINLGNVSKKCGMKTKIQKSALTVNDAVDFIQDKVNTKAMTVIHTGTNNLRRDSAKTVIQRFERLETNIKKKKLTKIALSSIVHRTDREYHAKTMEINKALHKMCVRNGWCYVDNGNIDSSSLWKDGLHLNSMGKHRLEHNIASSVFHFTKTQSAALP